MIDGIENETLATVYNANRQGAPDGTLNDISGYACATSNPGKYVVRFPSPPENCDEDIANCELSFRLDTFLLFRPGCDVKGSNDRKLVTVGHHNFG